MAVSSVPGAIGLAIAIFMVAMGVADAQSSGSVSAWGRNSQGQLGNGTTIDSATPIDVANLTGVTTIGAGGEHSLAALSDGTVWAWGQNANGQLGDGTLIDRSTPVQVPGLSGIIAVDGGLGHSLVLRDDGTVWSWGLNSNGQLGDGTTTDSTIPVQVSGLSGVVAVAAGGDHSVGLKSDGTVWAWGKNSDGQLGNGSKKKSSTPVQVSNLASVTAIAAGDAHSLAVASDGSVWAWGDNFYGQLGDGSTRDRNTPVQVSGLTEAVSLSGGSFHSLAVRTDGTVWAWGRNVFGQLGDGTTTDRNTAVQTSNLSTAIGVSAGAHHSLAVVSDGTSWAWGLNLYGQLGDGTTSNRSTPVQVSTTTPADDVTAGGFHSLNHTGQADTTPPTVSLNQPTEGDIVFHVETLSATASDDVAVDRVEFLIDGVIVATDSATPYEAIWDTTSLVDGSYQISARAVDASGNQAETAPVAVEVANAFEPPERLKVDFDAGDLSVTDYVRYGLFSVTLPDLLPARYQVPITDTDEDHGLVIEYLRHWEELDQATQNELGAFVDAWLQMDDEAAREAVGASSTSSESIATSDTSLTSSSINWEGCTTNTNGKTTCVYTSQPDGNFEIRFVPESLEGNTNDGVPEVDQIYQNGTELVLCEPIDHGNCNRVPDYVDRAAAAFEQARAKYSELGFRLPQPPTKATIKDARAKVIPTKIRFGFTIQLWEPTIVLSPVDDEYSTARHEFFHMVQYEYVALNQLESTNGTLGWLEATAQWGAHQAQRATDQDPDQKRHFSRLQSFLGRPHWWLFTYEESLSIFNPFRDQKRQYGAFIFAEYLEESLDAGRPADNTAVERTWELIETGLNAPEAVGAVISEGLAGGEVVADRIADFHVDAYVLDKDQHGLAGFTDPDVGVWQTHLSNTLGRDRPVAESRTLTIGDIWDPSDGERPHVVAGGSVYVEIGLDDGAGNPPQGVLTIDTPAISDLAYTVLAFDGYPNPCSDLNAPLRIDQGPGTAGHHDLTLTGSCDLVTLVISHTGGCGDPLPSSCLEPGLIGNLEPGFGNGVQTDWAAQLSSQALCDLTFNSTLSNGFSAQSVDSAFGDGFIWHFESISGELFKVDPTTGDRGSAIADIPVTIQYVAYDNGIVYAMGGADDVWVINGTTGTIIDTFDLTEGSSFNVNGLVHDGTHLISYEHFDEEIIKYDPSTGAVVSRTPLSIAGESVAGMEIIGSNLWISTFEGKIHVVDASTYAPVATCTSPITGGLTYTGSQIYMSEEFGSGYSIYDLASP